MLRVPCKRAAVIDITLSLVRDLVAAQFPEWSHLKVEAIRPGGWDNRSFRLGQDKLIRLPSAERYAAQVAKEQAWLGRLAPDLPLTIPKPLAQGRAALGFPFAWSV